jgi:dTDP-4-amino-4,6-dideoxygalactose transaminase
VRTNWHQYPVHFEKAISRQAVIDWLAHHGIQTLIHYNRLPVSRSSGYKPSTWERGWISTVLSLPIAEHLGEDEILRVIDVIRRYFDA